MQITHTNTIRDLASSEIEQVGGGLYHSGSSRVIYRSAWSPSGRFNCVVGAVSTGGNVYVGSPVCYDFKK